MNNNFNIEIPDLNPLKAMYEDECGLTFEGMRLCSSLIDVLCILLRYKLFKDSSDFEDYHVITKNYYAYKPTKLKIKPKKRKIIKDMLDCKGCDEPLTDEDIMLMCSQITEELKERIVEYNIRPRRFDFNISVLDIINEHVMDKGYPYNVCDGYKVLLLILSKTSGFYLKLVK